MSKEKTNLFTYGASYRLANLFASSIFLMILACFFGFARSYRVTESYGFASGQNES